MGKYWLKIGIKAAAIFLVGFAIISAGRRIKHEVVSDKGDITIPLGGFIPFKVDGIEAGKFRSLTIRRGESKAITGFEVSMRVSDSAAFERLRDCRFGVSDLDHIDERTSFSCLQSDSGFREFGAVRVSLRIPGGLQTMHQPLFLPEGTVRELDRKRSDSLAASPVDSLVSSVRSRVRSGQQAYDDSVEAARLEMRAKEMQRRADSIRNKAIKPQ